MSDETSTIARLTVTAGLHGEFVTAVLIRSATYSASAAVVAGSKQYGERVAAETGRELAGVKACEDLVGDGKSV